MSTNLTPHRRGDTFVYTFRLGGGWVGSDFTGGVKWTLRSTLVDSSVLTDDDAIHQSSVANGEIVFSGANGILTIPASTTVDWPIGKLYWDLQGVIDGTPDVVYTIDEGRISINHDITRSA